MYLTVREIIDLATFAGLTVTSSLNDEEMDAEIALGAYTTVVGDNGVAEMYRVVARCDGCEYNEVQPLGEPIGGKF